MKRKRSRSRVASAESEGGGAKKKPELEEAGPGAEQEEEEPSPEPRPSEEGWAEGDAEEEAASELGCASEETERVLRGGPRGPGAGGKGRSRRERERRTNWRVPAGHERKIAAKIRNSRAKKQRQAARGPRS